MHVCKKPKQWFCFSLNSSIVLNHLEYCLLGNIYTHNNSREPQIDLEKIKNCYILYLSLNKEKYFVVNSNSYSYLRKVQLNEGKKCLCEPSISNLYRWCEANAKNEKKQCCLQWYESYNSAFWQNFCQLFLAILLSIRTSTNGCFLSSSTWCNHSALLCGLWVKMWSIALPACGWTKNSITTLFWCFILILTLATSM